MEHWQLKQRQSLPLDAKITMSLARIREWYDYWQGNVYVAFSGGKDSTSLLNLVRSVYPEVPAVFINTGLEYPEIVEFVKTVDNVITLRPKKGFYKVIQEYGYPVAGKEISQKVYEIKTTKSAKLLNRHLNGNDRGQGALSKKWRILINAPFNVSHRCCYWLKKSVQKSFQTKNKMFPYVGTMTVDSLLRQTSYLKKGCNSFEGNNKSSQPLSFWLESDIWEYLKGNSIPYSEIYDMGYTRTGCMFCMFGVHLEKEPNRFQRMKNTHPKQYKYCMEVLGLNKVLDFIGVNYI